MDSSSKTPPPPPPKSSVSSPSTPPQANDKKHGEAIEHHIRVIKQVIENVLRNFILQLQSGCWQLTPILDFDDTISTNNTHTDDNPMNKSTYEIHHITQTLRLFSEGPMTDHFVAAYKVRVGRDKCSPQLDTRQLFLGVLMMFREILISNARLIFNLRDDPLEPGPASMLSAVSSSEREKQYFMSQQMDSVEGRILATSFCLIVLGKETTSITKMMGGDSSIGEGLISDFKNMITKRDKDLFIHEKHDVEKIFQFCLGLHHRSYSNEEILAWRVNWELVQRPKKISVYEIPLSLASHKPGNVVMFFHVDMEEKSYTTTTATTGVVDELQGLSNKCGNHLSNFMTQIGNL